MPKIKIEQPSENELIAHYLYPLLGGREQKLLKNILSIKNNHGELAFIEDKHTACLARLSSLLCQYPPDPQEKETKEIITIINAVLENCLPYYRLDEVYSALAVAEKLEFIENCIRKLKVKNWPLVYTAITLLQSLQQFYREDSQNLDRSYRVSVSIASPWGKMYYCTDQETARNLGCTTIKGKRLKSNVRGMHCVSSKEGAHYKDPELIELGSTQPKYINCGREDASIVLQSITGSPENVAPTTIMYMSGIPIISPRNEADYDFTDVFLQASLTIEGICLKDLLALTQILKVWRGLLLEEEFKEILEDAKNDFIGIKSNLMMTMPNATGIMEYETFSTSRRREECEILRNAIEAICKENPELQFRNVKKQSSIERAKNEFYELIQSHLRFGGLIEDICILLGLIKKFPILMKGKDTDDLLDNIKTIKTLFKVLPKLAALEAYEELKDLMDNPLFKEALSEVIVSSLIQPFGDGKAENVIIEVTCGIDGKIERFCFVRFDNDDNLLQPISMEMVNQENKPCLRVRDILFFLPFMKEPVSQAVKQRLANTSPSYEILKWLSILAFKNRVYSNWHVPQEKLEKLGLSITISIRIIKLMQQQWQTLKELVQERENITYEDCLRKLYPEIWVAYYSVEAGGFSNTFPPLPEDSSPPLAFETVLYKYFSLGYCDLRKLITKPICDTIGEDIEDLFESAQQKCRESDVELVEPIGFCLVELSQMNWTELDAEEAWQYVKIFSILPRDIAKPIYWQGKSQVENMTPRFQMWFNRAILEGNPLVTYRMLQLGAKINHVNIDTGKTALHLFCQFCLNYQNYETVELMARVLFSDPTCQVNHYSIEGPPLFSLVNATNPDFYKLSDAQKKIARYVLDCFCHCDVNLQVMNSIGHTLLDKAFQEILSLDILLLESKENIETWFVELVERGAISINESNLIDYWQKNFAAGYIKSIKGFENAIKRLREYNINLKFLFNMEALRRGTIPQPKSRSGRSQTMMGDGSHLSVLKIGARAQEPMLSASTWFINPIDDMTSSYPLSAQMQEVISENIHLKYSWRTLLTNELEIQNLFNPIRFGEEMAARIFCGLVMNGLTLPGNAFVIQMGSLRKKHEKDNGIIWVSPVIPGENLRTYLEKGVDVSPHETYLNRIAIRSASLSSSMDDISSFASSDSFSRLKPQNTLDFDTIILSTQIIIDIILGPKNNLPENFYVLNQDYSGEKKRNTIIRAKHYNTFSEFSKKDIPISILFCLPYMRENIPSVVMELLLGRLDGLLKEWIQKIYPYDQYFKAVHELNLNVGREGYESLKSSFSLSKKSSNLPSAFCIKQGFIEEFLNRLRNLKEELQKNPNHTHLSLLKKLWPASEGLYQAIFEKHPRSADTLERFNIIRSAVIHESVVSLTVGVSSGLDLKKALEETKIEEKMQSCLEQLSWGSLRILESIRSDVVRKELFRKIFSSDESKRTIPEKSQKAILKIYYTEWRFPFTELFIDCKLLNDMDLRKILELSPDLRSLSLINCSKLSENIFNIISSLEKLETIKLSGFYKFKKISIVSPCLTECYITNNLNLTHIAVNAPMLVKGEFCDNAQLIDIKLNATHILSLDFSGCNSLTDEILINILGNCHPMPYLKIDQCIGVKSRLLHHICLNNPQLLSSLDIEELKCKMYQLEQYFLKDEVKISDCEFDDLNLAIEMIEVLLKEIEILHSLIIDFQRALNDSRKNRIIFIIGRWIKKIVYLDLDSIKLNKEQWNGLYRALLKAELLEGARLNLFSKAIFPYFTSYLQTHSKICSLIIRDDNVAIDFAKRASELFELKENGVWNFPPSLVTRDDIPLIASLLTDNTDTFFCSFAGIALSSETLSLVLTALEENTTLMVLDLHACQLQEDSLFYLKYFLNKNKVIFFINLDLNYFLEKSIKSIVEQLIDRDLNPPIEIYQYLEKTAPIYHPDDFPCNLLPINEFSLQLYNRNRNEMNWPILKPARGYLNNFSDMKIDCLDSYSDPVLTMCHIFDGYVASAAGHIVTVWDINAKKKICDLKKHSDTVTALLYLKDVFFVSGSKDGGIIVWFKDVCKNEFTAFKILESHGKAITAIMAIGNMMVSASEDGIIHFWEIEEIISLVGAKPVATFPITPSNEVVFATKMVPVFMGELTLFLVGCNNGNIQVWKKQTPEKFYAENIDILSKHKSAILALTTLSLKPKLFIAVDHNSIITIWEYSENKGLKKEEKYECKQILMEGSIDHIFSFCSLPSFFSDVDAFISGGIGGIALWKDYSQQNFMSYVYPVNVIIQLPTGQFVIGSHDIRILSKVFPQEKKYLDIGFYEKYTNVSIVYEKHLIKVVFNGVKDAKEYEALYQFTLDMFYMCYARNSNWDNMKQAIFITDEGLYIKCPDEKFSMDIYHCLFSLFKPQNMVRDFLRLGQEKPFPVRNSTWTFSDEFLSSPLSFKKRSGSSLLSSARTGSQPPLAHSSRNIPSLSLSQNPASGFSSSQLFQNLSQSSKISDNLPSSPRASESSSSILALSQASSFMFKRSVRKEETPSSASLSSSSSHSPAPLHERPSQPGASPDVGYFRPGIKMGFNSSKQSGSNPDISRFRHSARMEPNPPK